MTMSSGRGLKCAQRRLSVVQLRRSVVAALTSCMPRPKIHPDSTLFPRRPSPRLAPAVSGFLQVIRKNVTPGKQGKEDNDWRDLEECFAGVGVDLVGSPQRQCETAQPDHFPEHLVDQERQHPQRMADSDNRQERERQKEAVRRSAGRRPMSVMKERLQPDRALCRRHERVEATQNVKTP